MSLDIGTIVQTACGCWWEVYGYRGGMIKIRTHSNSRCHSNLGSHKRRSKEHPVYTSVYFSSVKVIDPLSRELEETFGNPSQRS